MPTTPIAHVEFSHGRMTHRDAAAIIGSLLGTELPEGGTLGIARDGGFEGEVGQIELERVE